MSYKIYKAGKRWKEGELLEGADSVAEARDFIGAYPFEEGEVFYIRYTQDVRGGHEPNIEAYRIIGGSPELIWKDRKHRGMRNVLFPEEFPYGARRESYGSEFEENPYLVARLSSIASSIEEGSLPEGWSLKDILDFLRRQEG